MSRVIVNIDALLQSSVQTDAIKSHAAGPTAMAIDEARNLFSASQSGFSHTMQESVGRLLQGDARSLDKALMFYSSALRETAEDMREADEMSTLSGPAGV